MKFELSESCDVSLSSLLYIRCRIRKLYTNRQPKEKNNDVLQQHRERRWSVVWMYIKPHSIDGNNDDRYQPQTMNMMKAARRRGRCTATSFPALLVQQFILLMTILLLHSGTTTTAISSTSLTNTTHLAITTETTTINAVLISLNKNDLRDGYDYQRQQQSSRDGKGEMANFDDWDDDDDNDGDSWIFNENDEVHLRKLPTIFDRKQLQQQQQQQQEQGQQSQPRVGASFFQLNNIRSTSWIVRLSDIDSKRNDELFRNPNVSSKVKHRLKSFVNVIVVKGIARTTMKWLLRQPNVLSIEENLPVYGHHQSLPDIDDSVLLHKQRLRSGRQTVVSSPNIVPLPQPAPSSSPLTSPMYGSRNRVLQKGATIPSKVTVSLKDGQPWGIDMVDGTFDRKYTYTYSGIGVKVFVFDTGIVTRHDEFEDDRASCGLNTIVGETCEDLKGHGTHVAGTIGGKTYGMARNVELINVKVLDKNATGNVQNILDGLNYVMGQKNATPSVPMIINLSIGSDFSTTFNQYVERCVDMGIHVVIAAGNLNADACTISPSSASKGVTVGGSTPLFTRAEWSNYGPCVDMFAPGLTILSATYDPKDTKKTGYRSGTSMSAPHVAGLMALYLEWNPTLTPEQLTTYLVNDGRANILLNVGGDDDDDDTNNNILVSSAKVQTYLPVTRAPTSFPTIAPSMEPTRDNLEGGPDCARMFTPCITDDDCCFRCLNINLFNLGIWGSRCFIFG